MLSDWRPFKLDEIDLISQVNILTQIWIKIEQNEYRSQVSKSTSKSLIGLKISSSLPRLGLVSKQ